MPLAMGTTLLGMGMNAPCNGDDATSCNGDYALTQATLQQAPHTQYLCQKPSQAAPRYRRSNIMTQWQRPCPAAPNVPNTTEDSCQGQEVSGASKEI